MPINNKYPIENILEACLYYIKKTKRRVTFEWALIHGVTDTPDVACELGTLLKGMSCHVNAIPLNPTSGFSGNPSTKKSADIFVATLVWSINYMPRLDYLCLIVVLIF